MAKILITGGTGLVGSALTKLLLAKGYEVAFLSRSARILPKIQVYQWDIHKGTIDARALQGVEAIVHLAGENVGEGTWSPQRKQQILDSRVLSTRLLANTLRNTTHQVKTFVAASAVGIYGMNTGAQLLTEDSPTTEQDFLSKVTTLWEREIDEIDLTGIRTVRIRIGVVLSRRGGALAKMATPVRMFVGAALGTGQQYISWIHEADLANIFLYAIENAGMSGIYNGVASEPVTNENLTKAIGSALGRPILPINVPPFVLKAALGEMAAIVLGGNRLSNEKIKKTGFQFQFDNIEAALKDLL